MHKLKRVWSALTELARIVQLKVMTISSTGCLWTVREDFPLLDGRWLVRHATPPWSVAEVCDVNNPWRRRQQRDKETHDFRPCIVTSTTEKFPGPIFLLPLEHQRICAIDELVGSLDKVFLQLLQFTFFPWPVR